MADASAAEAAFGRDLELLVVDKGNHVLDVAQACAGVRGRVTMAPADLPAAVAVARPERAGIAQIASVLRVREAASGIVARFLADTWLAEDLQMALDCAAVRS